MASTYTDRLGLEKQTDGENPNSWGAILNTNVIDLLDDAIAGYTVVSVSGVPLTLTDNSGSTDQSRNAALEFAGTLTALVTITVPSEQKTYFVRENTSGSFGVQMKTVGGTALSLQQGVNIFVACDGTSIYKVDTPVSVSNFTANTLIATSITTSILDATDINATNISATDIVTSIIGTSIMNATYINTSSVSTTVLNVDGAATFSGPVVATEVVTIADATNIAVNLAQSNNFYVQMTSAVGSGRTLANPTNAVIGQCGVIYVIQAVSGVATKTMSFGTSYRFKDGLAPTITQSTSAVDMLVYNVRASNIIDVLPAQNLKAEV